MTVSRHALRAVALGATLLASNAHAGDELASGPGGPPEDLRASCAPVGYPSEAVLRWTQGTTRLRYAVGADGRALAIEVTSPSGSTPRPRRRPARGR
jgi:outer membrane biosynthesis protein TonB